MKFGKNVFNTLYVNEEGQLYPYYPYYCLSADNSWVLPVSNEYKFPMNNAA